MCSLSFFETRKFLVLFSGFIHNVAAKYGLEVTQIAVSSVKENGLTSFHVMPFFAENMEDFERKMDQIDTDVMKTPNLRFIFLFYNFYLVEYL
jgi:hypothetical protein